MAKVAWFDGHAGDGDPGSVAFGLSDLHEPDVKAWWKVFARAFLILYATPYAAVAVVETPVRHDWYTGFCEEVGIPIHSSPLPHGFVRLVMAPTTQMHREALFEALVLDEAFEVDGLLSFCMGPDGTDAEELADDPLVRVRPYSDGTVLEWGGPTDLAAKVPGMVEWLVRMCGGELAAS